ncbi:MULTISPECIES: hypothetical protein [unclassified Streptomyces]|uniref:hypothetical protein n=1 Tax=unclassified Streptomyces TaxID=2593676 RepID=UPI0034497CF9
MSESVSEARAEAVAGAESEAGSEAAPAVAPAADAAVPAAGPAADPEAGPGSGDAPGAEYDPAAPAPLNVPRTPTGDAGVDERLQRLADADHLATDGHMEVYEDVHRGLRDALTALDARPGPQVPVPPYRNRS